MAEMFVANVAGADVFGGDTRWDIYKAIVDGEEGSGAMLSTDLVNCAYLDQARWYCSAELGARAEASRAAAPVTREAMPAVLCPAFC